MNVIDAKTMSPDPIAIVELPNRVPYGFHAFFVTEVSMLTPGSVKFNLSEEKKKG